MHLRGGVRFSCDIAVASRRESDPSQSVGIVIFEVALRKSPTEKKEISHETLSVDQFVANF